MATAYADLDSPLLTGEPLKLHTQAVEYGGLGGHAYSGPFARHLQATLAAKRAVENARGCAWWENAYVRALVNAKMARLHRGGPAYVLLLAEAQGRITWDEAIARYEGNGPGLRRMYYRLVGFARQAGWRPY